MIAVAGGFEGPDRQRVDKWLFFARVVKSRSLAARLVADGGVRLNGEKITQVARSVKSGDVLTITLNRRIVVYEIVACGERRGPAPEAQQLYIDQSPLPATRSTSRLDGLPPVREPGAGRPTKKDRRAIDRLQKD